MEAYDHFGWRLSGCFGIEQVLQRASSGIDGVICKGLAVFNVWRRPYLSRTLVLVSRLILRFLEWFWFLVSSLFALVIDSVSGHAEDCLLGGQTLCTHVTMGCYWNNISFKLLYAQEPIHLGLAKAQRPLLLKSS